MGLNGAVISSILYAALAWYSTGIEGITWIECWRPRLTPSLGHYLIDETYVFYRYEPPRRNLRDRPCPLSAWPFISIACILEDPR